MTVADSDLSEEAKLKSWLGVTIDEAEEMDRQVALMLAEIRSLQERSHAADQHIKRSAADTRVVLNRLMADLKLP